MPAPRTTPMRKLLPLARERSPRILSVQLGLTSMGDMRNARYVCNLRAPCFFSTVVCIAADKKPCGHALKSCSGRAFQGWSSLLHCVLYFTRVVAASCASPEIQDQKAPLNFKPVDSATVIELCSYILVPWTRTLGLRLDLGALRLLCCA